MQKLTPTDELYSALQTLYDHFNETLFEKSLPQILFTTQRQPGMMGYFSADRWTSDNKKKCHELAINPSYVGRATLVELMQTLVHEMAHCWQYCYGTPSVRSYHNKEWASKMVSIGLIPSTTGKPGGNIVGQHMDDYPAPKGKFINECVNLLKDKKFNLPWVDRYATVNQENSDSVVMEALEGVDVGFVNQLVTDISSLLGEGAFLPPKPPTSTYKRKYTCPECGTNMWGKPGLTTIGCFKCEKLLVEQ